MPDDLFHNLLSCAPTAFYQNSDLRIYFGALKTSLFPLKTGTWYDTIIGYLKQHAYFTEYAQTHIEPKKQELIKKIKKESQKATGPALKKGTEYQREAGKPVVFRQFS